MTSLLVLDAKDAEVEEEERDAHEGEGRLPEYEDGDARLDFLC